jgi:hypothetical protein
VEVLLLAVPVVLTPILLFQDLQLVLLVQLVISPMSQLQLLLVSVVLLVHLPSQFLLVLGNVHHVWLVRLDLALSVPQPVLHAPLELGLLLVLLTVRYVQQEPSLLPQELLAVKHVHLVVLELTLLLDQVVVEHALMVQFHSLLDLVLLRVSGVLLVLSVTPMIKIKK